MSESPPPSGPPPGFSDSAERRPARTFQLATPGGFGKRLLGGSRRGVHEISFAPNEIVIQHTGSLRAPLRFAPGSVVFAASDPGPGTISKGESRGRFPVLRRLSKTAVIPRSEGIEGWLWTSEEGSALTVLGDQAPNLAFMFTPPLSGYVVLEAFEPHELEELAKRSPLGEPAVFGLLLRVERADEVRKELELFSFNSLLTDREVPPVQRRHLPDDKPANPTIARSDASRAETSVPPPGFSR